MHGYTPVAVVTIDDDGYLIGIASVSEPDHLPVGTLAGDDTIFVLMRGEDQAEALAAQITAILDKH